MAARHWWAHCAGVPSGRAAFLLQLAFARPADARVLWQRWRKSEAGREPEIFLTTPAARLVPLAFQRLRALGCAGPELGAWHASFRRSWLENKLLFAACRPVLQAVAQKVGRVCLLKGAALVARHYPHPGVRPMNDIDVLLPAARAGDAIALLEQRGMQSERPQPQAVVGTRHSTGFQGPGRVALDLHWHLAPETAHSGLEEELLETAEPTDVLGCECFLPGSEALLLHISVHNALFFLKPQCYGFADALTLIQCRRPALDWRKFEEYTRRTRTEVFVTKLLYFLSRSFGACVPEAVLDRLRSTDLRRGQLTEYAAVTRPWMGVGPELKRAWFRSRRLLPEVPLWQRLAHLGQTLQLDWQLPSQVAVWRRVLGGARPHLPVGWGDRS